MLLCKGQNYPHLSIIITFAVTLILIYWYIYIILSFHMFSKKHLYWQDLLFCQGHKLLFFFFILINFTKYSLLWCHFSPLWEISIPRCCLLLNLVDVLPTRFHLFLCRLDSLTTYWVTSWIGSANQENEACPRSFFHMSFLSANPLRHSCLLFSPHHSLGGGNLKLSYKVRGRNVS